MGGVLFMALGGLYLQYEFQVDRYIGKVRYGLVVALYIVLIGFDVEGLGRNVLMSMDFNLLGFLQSLLGFFVVVGLCKKMTEVRPLSYIGKHSIVFYFLSGVFPASLAFVLRKLMPSSYMSNCVVFVLSLVASSIGALIIGKYLPFLLDIRRLGFLKK
jgi:surface polysaccharide O-acyltransferase-like enzyme